MRKSFSTLSILLMIVFVAAGTAQTGITVQGKVTDDAGTPLTGANVLIINTAYGAATDVNGDYSLTVPTTESGNQVSLRAEYIGYSAASVTVILSPPIVTQNFELSVDVLQMKSVSVTALGFQANRDQQGSTSVPVAAGDMARSGESLIANSLAAKASNVVASAVSGDPGAGTSIRIRGHNTISGASQPLIIVDGVPTNNSQIYAGHDRFGGTSQQSRVNDLNINDIESVEVLKGASAAALWGSRAANGVIVVKTKEGAPGKMRMSYKRTKSFDEIHERIPMQTVWGQGRNGSAGTQAESWGDYIPDRSGGADEVDTSGDHFVSEDGTFTQYKITGKNSKEIYVDSNWDQIFQTGTYDLDDFQISGGDATKTYLFSYGRMRQDGIVRNAFYDRDNVRLNTKFWLSDWITMNSKIGYTYSNSNRLQRGSNVAGLLLGLLRNAPDFDLTHYKGTFVDVDSDGNKTEYSDRHRAYRRNLGGPSTNPIYNNPLWTINEQMNLTTVNRLIISNEMNITPSDRTDIVLRAGVDTFTDNREGFFPPGSSGSARNSGLFNIDRITNRETSYGVIARQNVPLGSSASMLATIGYSMNDRAYSRGSSSITGFLVNTDKHTTNVNTAAEASSVSNSRLFIRSTRTYGILSIDALDQIYLNLSGALEDHSTIKESYFYPAADLAYQFTDMVSGALPISFGKLRVAYGQVGVRPSAHRFETLAESGFTYSTYSDPLEVGLWGGGYRVDDDRGNPDLKPEVKTETEIGMDLRFFDDKFALSFTSYQNEINDMLINVSLSPSSGYDTQYKNAARMENKGFELDGSWNMINQTNMGLDLIFNWATNKNEVLDLAGTEVIYLGSGSVNSVARVGFPIGALYGTGSLTEDGTVDGKLVLDDNGFPQITPLPIVLGDPNPDWRGTVGLNAHWKNFRLNILFEHSQGGRYSPRTQWVLRRFGTTMETAERTTLTQDLINVDGDTILAGTSVRGSVHDFGGGDVLLDEAWYRHGIGGGFGDNQAYNFSIKDATFSRIKELTLSYTLASPAFREKTRLSSVTFSATARNLWAWYKELVGVDPAVNVGGIQTGFGLDYFANPSTKSYLFSIEANF
ncbi:MAG: SusC/RagA family TonB-linked outer membrane protein [Candidatus Marinimicrobia bacterium]|nr:SusC/RagA family TonB-linked outer membrane protein [Candidatus Neomarinimicrobiota bacterium]MDP6457131.1 SusC/RagA family TonB-linked outer membrane protein [Candidatus Neomarinimicrobiota bacterium]MDP6594241.1 SusC/RagA family TonB-linked outer membrane protein [Candidatus Neomarinimicrobiota bacterium]MDP6836685.1 SusC/RagA family TonB-linked outer membrane protein [Candidatus Neomarinimicrobiota bacterium]